MRIGSVLQPLKPLLQVRTTSILASAQEAIAVKPRLLTLSILPAPLAALEKKMFSLSEIGSFLGKGLLCYIAVTMTLTALVAMWQERKIWTAQKLPSLSLFGHLKVFLFNVIWILMCLMGSSIISAKWLLTGGKSDIQYDGNCWVERNVARACITALVGQVEVIGKENLPPENSKDIPAPIYIANHASQIDVGAVYYIFRRFKWVAKQSVLYLPGVGQIMWLSGHILIQRDKKKGNAKRSTAMLFEKSDNAVQSGIPMFFFPQGSRRIAQKLPFKDGAFIVAQKNKSTLVPLSIEVPMNAWNTWYPLNKLWGSKVTPKVKITVHKPVPVTGEEDRSELKKRCMDQIYSVLPDIYQASKKTSPESPKEK